MESVFDSMVNGETPTQAEVMKAADKMVNKWVPSAFTVSVVPPTKAVGPISGPVFYEVTVSTFTDSWTVKRRYAEFEEFQSALWRKGLGRSVKVDLPSKSPKPHPGDTRALSKRAAGLERWACAVVRDEEALKLQACIKFFGLYRAPSDTLSKRSKFLGFFVLWMIYVVATGKAHPASGYAPGVGGFREPMRERRAATPSASTAWFPSPFGSSAQSYPVATMPQPQKRNPIESLKRSLGSNGAQKIAIAVASTFLFANLPAGLGITAASGPARMATAALPGGGADIGGAAAKAAGGLILTRVVPALLKIGAGGGRYARPVYRAARTGARYGAGFVVPKIVWVPAAIGALGIWL